uniref:COBRA-like protein n=1 Tax=Opuntia streptacantha TaxID=393608 RepID=A0A7C8ZZP1_OPUST
MKMKAGLDCASILGIVIVVLSLSCFSFTTTEAYLHRHEPKGNITIKWDVINWTPDGYVAVVTIYNFQKHRGIEKPGWTLGWTWSGKEVIWSMVGGQTTEQGDCSKFKGNIPHSCKKNPTVVDLLPGTPFYQQIEHCCKGGVLTSWFQDRANSTGAFQISVGQAGTTPRTVRLPNHFKFTAPQAAYACGPARVVRPTRFITADKRRFTTALKTWRVTCFYSGKRKTIN